jgi:hypothetical protein
MLLNAELCGNSVAERQVGHLRAGSKTSQPPTFLSPIVKAAPAVKGQYAGGLLDLNLGCMVSSPGSFTAITALSLSLSAS